MSNISNEMQVSILRGMAWERAKGELRSIVATYYGEEENYTKMRDLVEEFIENVVGEGAHE